MTIYIVSEKELLVPCFLLRLAFSHDAKPCHCQGGIVELKEKTIAINLYPFLTFTKLMGIERDFLFPPKLLNVVVLCCCCYTFAIGYSLWQVTLGRILFSIQFAILIVVLLCENNI